MFFNLPQNSIGIKRLTDADLGSKTSHQTHIGLYEGTLSHLPYERKSYNGQLIYDDNIFEGECFIKFINNNRSPALNMGTREEQLNLKPGLCSIAKKIREIVKNEEDKGWYLIWFSLENEDLVFLLIKKDSSVYNEIVNITGEINDSKGLIIQNSNKIFNEIIKFLNKKVNDLNIEYEEELEIVVQTGEIITEKRIKPRVYDIEKAKAIFKEIGKKGEELVNNYLKKLKEQNEISDFRWMNEKKESGMPYDFEITQNNGEVFFTDVKSTSYKFEQRMIFSGQEFKFINQNANYLIHRVFNLNESPALKICTNVNVISDDFIPKLNTFNTDIVKAGLRVNSVKIEVPPILEILTFNDEILLV